MATVNVGTLVAVLKADVSKWIPGMKKAGKAADATGMQVKNLNKTLTGLAASIGGAAVALTALDWAEQSAQALQAKQIYEGTGGSIEKLRKATRGMISDAELVKKANMAKELKITETQFADLAKTAVAASKVMGLSQKEAFERIVLGTAKMEREILEETGIVFKAETAFKKYAKAHGLVAAKMTDVQKSAAFTNEVIERGKNIIKTAGLASSKAADNIARLRAKFANLKDEVGNRLLPVIGRIGAVLSDVIDMWNKLEEPVKRGIFKMLELGAIVLVAAGAFAALATPIGQFLALLAVVAFSIGLVASVFTEELGLMEKNSTIANANMKQIFKSGFLAILATIFTLSGGVALVMDTIAYGIIESLAGIAMIFTVFVDTVKSFWSTLGSFILDILKKIAGGINSLIQSAPGIPDSIKAGAQAAVDALNAIDMKKGLDLGLTKQVIAAKEEMQRTTFKFTPEETPQELAEKTMKGINELMERSADGLKSFLGAIGGAGEKAAKQIATATKKANDEAKKAGIKDGTITVEHTTPGNKGGTGFDPFEAFTKGAGLFGEHGLGAIGKAFDMLITDAFSAAGGIIATALGVNAPGVGEAIGQGLMKTAGQIGEVIAMAASAVFDRLIRPIFEAGSGRFSGAMGAGMEAGIGAGVLGLLAALGIILAAVLIPALSGVAVLMSPIIIGLGLLASGILTLVAIILFVPAVIGTVIAALAGLAGFILAMALESESFSRFGDALDFATDILIRATEPLFEAFMPLAGVAIMIAEGFAVLITTLVQVEPLMRAVFEGVKILGLALLGLATVLTAITGGDVGAVTEAFVELQRATFESAGALAENAVAAQESAEATRNFREELLNLAPGFNHRLAMSQASTPSGGASTIGVFSLANSFSSSVGRPKSARI